MRARSPIRIPAALPTLPQFTAFVLLLVAPAVAAVALHSYMGRHAVLPGLDGCSRVRNGEAQIGCYSTQFKAIVSHYGTEQALARVDQLAKSSPSLQADCHLGWHQVAESVGKADGANGRPLRHIVTASHCQEGYLHGYMIGYLANTSFDAATASAQATQMCSGAGLIGSPIRAAEDAASAVRASAVSSVVVDRSALNCVHSYGHVFARQLASQRQASTLCMRIDYRTFPTGKAAEASKMLQFQCLYGVYMEYGLQAVQHAAAPTNNCVHSPAGEPQRACYAYLPARIATLRGDPIAGLKACEWAPQGTMRTTCIATYGRALTSAAPCRQFAATEDRLFCADVARAVDRSTADAAPISKAPPAGAPPSMPAHP